MENNDINKKILNKKFKINLHGGYDPDDVDNFFDEINEQIKQLINSIQELKNDMQNMQTQINDLKNKLKNKDEQIKEFVNESYGHIINNKKNLNILDKQNKK